MVTLLPGSYVLKIFGAMHGGLAPGAAGVKNLQTKSRYNVVICKLFKDVRSFPFFGLAYLIQIPAQRDSLSP